MENIETGLMLMLVGMCTVFVILLIVIWLSTLLIKVVNKFAPPEEVVKAKPSVSKYSADNGTTHAIKAAVDIITAGKGRVINIEKIN